MHAASDDAGPTGLMAGAETSTIVSVEVLVEQEEVAPVRIILEFVSSTVYGTVSHLVLQEDVSEAARNLLGHLIKVHAPARACRTFHGEIIAVVTVVLQQGAYDEGVDRHPDGAAPVG